MSIVVESVDDMPVSTTLQVNAFFLIKHCLVAYRINQLEETNLESVIIFSKRSKIYNK